MKNLITSFLSILFGFGTGLAIAGGIIAFITIIGVIPMLATQTRTIKYSRWYDHAIMIGAITGGIFSIWKPFIPISPLLIVIFGFSFGIFVGVLIIALAEVLDIFPIINRRIKVKKGISIIILALAAGKLIGSLYYWLYPIFIQLS